MTSRREFLEAIAAAGGAGGLLAGLAALGGCGEVSERLAVLLDPEAPLSPSIPAGESFDATTHLLNRLTWGPRPEDRAAVEAIGAETFIERQLAPATIDDRRCEWRIAEIETLSVPRAELYEFTPAQILRDLSRARILRALHSKRQLLELMVDFWSDHFNIGVAKGDCRWMKLADDREVIRPHALGRFRDLLRASVTSPAMLVFLDGADNRVVHPEDRPNENHARELLELHTLGVHGGYTQDDVREVARCLSGWTFTHDWRRFFTARVAFDPRRHDGGRKTVLGTSIPAGGGAEDIDRVVDILCTHPSTAKHVGTRLVRAFVGDPPPAEAVAIATEAFTASQGDIPAILRAIFASQEFDRSRGVLLKRPMRFVVSALRAIEARCDAGPALLTHLERLGQAPFAYPTPDGYPLEAAPWLGTLLWRWNFALDLAHGRIAGTRLDAGELASRMGGAEGLARHILGRAPTALEQEVFATADLDALALALASPAFQRH